MVGGLGTQIVDLNSPLTLPLSPPAADGRDVAYSILEYYKLELCTLNKQIFTSAFGATISYEYGMAYL
jgi:hypothetical protein